MTECCIQFWIQNVCFSISKKHWKMYASIFHVFKYTPQCSTHNDQRLPTQIPSHTQRPNCGCQQISLTQISKQGGGGWGLSESFTTHTITKWGGGGGIELFTMGGWCVTIFHYTHNNQMRRRRGGGIKLFTTGGWCVSFTTHTISKRGGGGGCQTLLLHTQSQLSVSQQMFLSAAFVIRDKHLWPIQILQYRSSTHVACVHSHE